MKITEKLAMDAFKNDKESHILLEQQICHTCQERFCIYACPTNLYVHREKGEMTVEFAEGLECGTCMIACVYGSVKWKYPKSGFQERVWCPVSAWMMGTKSTFGNALALIRYQPEANSLARLFPCFQTFLGR